ncbi:hypothetical protein B0H14DRAFT_3132879 [Mycena olivaceomarginata]|nr:hypothetical protein B0H14DRAFT_3132879 [Mycena olivaceomarginata]
MPLLTAGAECVHTHDTLRQCPEMCQKIVPPKWKELAPDSRNVAKSTSGICAGLTSTAQRHLERRSEDGKDEINLWRGRGRTLAPSMRMAIGVKQQVLPACDNARKISQENKRVGWMQSGGEVGGKERRVIDGAKNVSRTYAPELGVMRTDTLMKDWAVSWLPRKTKNISVMLEENLLEDFGKCTSVPQANEGDRDCVGEDGKTAGAAEIARDFAKPRLSRDIQAVIPRDFPSDRDLSQRDFALKRDFIFIVDQAHTSDKEGIVLNCNYYVDLSAVDLDTLDAPVLYIEPDGGLHVQQRNRYKTGRGSGGYAWVYTPAELIQGEMDIEIEGICHLVEVEVTR